MTPAAARLLIVDDESAQMRALCDTLGLEGYETHGFSSAKQARGKSPSVPVCRKAPSLRR